MGTVYRNLNILAEQGLANKIDFGSTFDRFDANVDEHYHFVCEKCHAIVDLDIPIELSLNEKVNATHQLKAIRHNIQFYGICEKCQKESR